MKIGNLIDDLGSVVKSISQLPNINGDRITHKFENTLGYSLKKDNTEIIDYEDKRKPPTKTECYFDNQDIKPYSYQTSEY